MPKSYFDWLDCEVLSGVLKNEENIYIIFLNCYGLAFFIPTSFKMLEF